MLAHPNSDRAQEDARLLRLIRASFTASQGIYGAPRVFLDLREAGETCSKHRVARLMRAAIVSQAGSQDYFAARAMAFIRSVEAAAPVNLYAESCFLIWAR